MIREQYFIVANDMPNNNLSGWRSKPNVSTQTLQMKNVTKKDLYLFSIFFHEQERFFLNSWRYVRWRRECGLHEFSHGLHKPIVGTTYEQGKPVPKDSTAIITLLVEKKNDTRKAISALLVIISLCRCSNREMCNLKIGLANLYKISSVKYSQTH